MAGGEIDEGCKFPCPFEKLLVKTWRKTTGWAALDVFKRKRKHLSHFTSGRVWPHNLFGGEDQTSKTSRRLSRGCILFPGYFWKGDNMWYNANINRVAGHTFSFSDRFSMHECRLCHFLKCCHLPVSQGKTGRLNNRCKLLAEGRGHAAPHEYH